MELTSFKSVLEQYKIVFFDAYGVLRNSAGLIPGIGKTFDFLLEKNINYYVLTNDASRSPAGLAEHYHKMGLQAITEDKIISSGMLAREFLQNKVKKGTVAYLGTEQSAHYIEELGLHTLPISQLDLNDVQEVNALVFLDDEGFEWRLDINKLVNLLRVRNIPIIVANTDKSYPVTTNEVAIAVGSISDMVEKIIGKKFIKFGKPDAQMFIFAYEHTGKTAHKNDVLMVGDTLFTDILGGNKFGIDTALVLTGNTLAANADIRIASTGIIPDFICESAVID